MNLVYAWCVQHLDEDNYETWHNELLDLLPWEDANSEAAAEIESASFMNMMGKGG